MSKTFKLRSLFIKFQLPSKTEQTLKPNPQAMSIQNISIVSLINSCMENSLSGLPQHYYYSHYSLY